MPDEDPSGDAAGSSDLPSGYQSHLLNPPSLETRDSSPLSLNYSKQNTGQHRLEIFPLKHRLKRLLCRLKLLLFFLALLLAPAAQSIKCFCTDDHCVPAYGVCESNVCLVGLRRPDLTVIRTCGEEPLGCQHNLEHWVDLCACDQPFCNTFSYLREMTQDNAFPPPPLTAGNAQPQMQHPANDDNYMSHGSRHHDLIVDEDTRIFQRVDGPPGEYIDEHGVRRQATLSTQTSLFTTLMVVVPLSVGFAATLIVSFNYYCHLC